MTASRWLVHGAYADHTAPPFPEHMGIWGKAGTLGSNRNLREPRYAVVVIVL
jgi:hypothetical protein